MTPSWNNATGRALTITVRISLGAVFIYASGYKILDPAAFARAISNYHLLPPLLINPAALILPWLELVCGICLLCGRLARGSALIVAILLSIFIGALTQGIYRGLDIHCGCFSLNAQSAASSYRDIMRDVVLLAMAGLVLWKPGPSIPANRQTPHYDNGL